MMRLAISPPPAHRDSGRSRLRIPPSDALARLGILPAGCCGLQRNCCRKVYLSARPAALFYNYNFTTKGKILQGRAVKNVYKNTNDRKVYFMASFTILPNSPANTIGAARPYAALRLPFYMLLQPYNPFVDPPHDAMGVGCEIFQPEPAPRRVEAFEIHAKPCIAFPFQRGYGKV